MKPLTDWSRHETTICEMWARGDKVQAIANRIGLSRHAATVASHIRQKLALPPRKASPMRFYRPAKWWLRERERQCRM